MDENLRQGVQEAFAECFSNVQRAELYAELFYEIRKQLEYCMEESAE